MNKQIRVMLVEDNPEYRGVVQRALSSDKKIELTSTVGTAERAVSILQQLSTLDAPDVVLLDLNLPGMSGLDAISSISQSNPSTKILILTQSDNEADVMRAISLGAAGYLLKSATLSQIKEGIQTVMDGGASLDVNVAKFILSTLRSIAPEFEADQLLTAREMEILTLLSEGLVKKEIAGQLDISYNTVVTHVAHIYGKLNVQNSPAAIAKAFRMGIFE